MDKKLAWSKIVDALQEIIDEVDMVEDMDDMSAMQLNELAANIKAAAQKVRSAAHDYIRPDKEDE